MINKFFPSNKINSLPLFLYQQFLFCYIIFVFIFILYTYIFIIISDFVKYV
jgi:hypothetical protein